MKIYSLLFVLVTGHLVLISDCQTPGCVLPSVLQGSWAMTRFGLTNLGFNTTHVTQFPVDNTTCWQCDPTYDFYCYRKTGTQYVLKSVKYAPLGGIDHNTLMYMCWDLKVVDLLTVVVHELTSLGHYGANRVKRADEGDPLPESCNLITSNSDHGLLLKLDSLDTYSKTCPADILGKYVNKTSSCTLQIDVCTDNTTIALSSIKDECSAKPLFTDESFVKCLHGEVQDGTTYLTVYNKDNSKDDTTQPFTCLAIQKSGDVVLMSQNPLFCLSDQTADSKTRDSFSPIELCPILNATTTPPPTTPPTTPTTGLGPGAIAGIVFAILLLVALIVIILLCWCLLRKRRKKKQEEEEQNVLDRESVRDHNDTDSVDSGCPPVPAVHFLEDEDDNEHKKGDEKKRRKRHRKFRRKRRIIGPNGEIIYEENDPGDASDKEYSDDFEEGDDEITGNHDPGKKRKLKRRVRKYIRQRIGPGGQMITEEVESEYYETDSDGSVESWEIEPISAEIERAKEKRKRELNIFGHDPLFQTKSILTRTENERRFQPEMMKSTQDILKKLGKTKGKNVVSDEIGDDSLSNEDRITPFMKEYQYKTSMDRMFEDQGFLDDPANKTTAIDIFEFDKQDERLDGKKVEDLKDQTDISKSDQVSGEHRSTSGKSTHKGDRSSAMMSQSNSSLMFNGSDDESTAGSSEHSTDDSNFLRKSRMTDSESWKTQNDDDSNTQQEKERVQAAIRHLLTERLFGSRRNGTKEGSSGKKGKTTPKVIFVDEYNKESNKGVSSPHRTNGTFSQQNTNGVLSPDSSYGVLSPYGTGLFSPQSSNGILSPGSSSIDLPPLRGPLPPGIPPNSSSYPYASTTGSSMFNDADDKDKRYDKRGQKSHMHWFTTDYNGGTERRFDKHIDNEEKLFQIVPGPHHLALTKRQLVTPRMPSVSRREVYSDEQVTPISQTSGSRHIDVLSMSEWRLRKLLEELYKDKKYMDGLLDPQGKPVQVKEIAHYGRDYLLQMADFWESKGVLPPRPYQTIPGSMAIKRAKTSLSLNTDDEASRPKLARNKTMF